MSDTDDKGEKAFQLLKGWTETNNSEIAKGNPTCCMENGADAFVALGIVLSHVEQFMSVDRRRAMALAVEKALTP